MELKTNDKVIVFFIKYAPIIFVIILSFFSTQIVLFEREKNFKEEIIELEKDYYDRNKKRVKEEVEKVYNYIQTEKQKTEQLLKESIKQKVYEAHSIANTIYKKHKNNKSKEEIFELIKTTLGSIIFNDGRGYYFIGDKNGTSLLQPLNPSFEGKNLSDYKDANGYKLFNAMSLTIKDKSERFDEYYWYKNQKDSKTYKKISFYKYFAPFDIVIGTGEYFVDFENKLKQKMLNYIKDIRYANDAYIFVIDFEGKYLAHYKTNLIGKNRIDYKNKAGKYLVKDIINFAKNKDGQFMTYVATINTDSFARSNKKISYIRKIDGYKWSIGTGFYTEALNKKIEEKRILLEQQKNESIEKIIKISIITTILLLIISFIISRTLERRLHEYKKEIESKILENKEKDNLMYQQSKMATMGEMIANIAHQWRQPLNQISTISTGIKIQQEINTLDIERLSSNMDKINKSVQYLSNTIDDFRNFFSPNKIYANFDLSNTIDKTLKLLDSKLKYNNIQIIKKIEDLEINSNENELLQVLINILKNAQEAIVDNKQIGEKLLFIDVKSDKHFVYISIKDNANGINEELIDKIFDPYITTKGDEGTGIGLYMSKNIITQSLNGYLKVENCIYSYKEKEYKGAKFEIKLPLNRV